MDKEFMLRTLCSMMTGLAQIMGKRTEIAIHDIAKGEIVFIANSEITGRVVGTKIHRSIYDVVFRASDQHGNLIAYRSTTRNGNQLKSSHVLIKDEAGREIFMICFNVDISAWVSFNHVLNEAIGITELDVLPINHDEEKYINKIVNELILKEIENSKPYTLDSKESKMAILRRLDYKGVLEVKDAVAQICDMLSISQATYYNYIREIKQTSEMDQNDQEFGLLIK